jgi:hypothetical protein
MAKVHPFGAMAFSGLATGRSRPLGLCGYSVTALPTDPIGTATVTFSGVNANSEIRVYRADGVESAGVELCDANHALTWSVYAPGANSIFRVVVVHPDYKIKEFTYTPTVGAQNLPIQQEADKWYSNPA